MRWVESYKSFYPHHNNPTHKHTIHHDNIRANEIYIFSAMSAQISFVERGKNYLRANEIYSPDSFGALTNEIYIVFKSSITRACLGVRYHIARSEK